MRPATDLDPVLLDRWREPGAHHYAQHASFEFAVARVVPGDPLGEEFVHHRRPPSGRPSQAGDAAIEGRQREDPPAQCIVDRRAELVTGEVGREVDQRSGGEVAGTRWQVVRSAVNRAPER